MGAGTSAEEFFLKSINVESIFEFVERTDYLFLYSIKECVEKSDCHEGVYLSEVAEYMKLSIPETSKMVKSLENKGYIIWKLDEKKERTYLVLTNKAIELSNCQKEKMIEAYGNDAKYIVDGAKENGMKNAFYFNNKEELSNKLFELADKGDAVIFKASRGMKLEDVINNVYDRWEK